MQHFYFQSLSDTDARTDPDCMMERFVVVNSTFSQNNINYDSDSSTVILENSNDIGRGS